MRAQEPAGAPPLNRSTLPQRGAPGDGTGSGGVLAAVRAHPFLVIGATLAALIAALVAGAVRTPAYEASAQMLVTPLDGDGPDPRLPLLRESGDPTRVVQTAANLIDSDAAAAAAASAMGPGWTRAGVEQAVDVEPQGQSDVVAITARADHPDTAARLANEFARAALDARRATLRPLVADLIEDTRRELTALPDSRAAVADELARRLVALQGLEDGSDPTLSLSQGAAPPPSPTGPPAALLAVLGLIAGLAVGAGGALLLETFGTRRVGDAAEAAAVTGLPVLARIPRLPMRRRGQGLLEGVTPDAAAAFRAVQAQLGLGHEPTWSEHPGRARVLLLTSPSAGDATATCAAGFGLALADAGFDVLLVDLAPAARPGADRDEAVPSPQDSNWRDEAEHLSHVPRLSVLNVDEPRDIGRLLSQARSALDYVLIAAPPLDEPEAALRVLAAVDGVLLMVEPGRTSVADLEAGLDLLWRTGGRAEGLLVTERRRRTPPRRSRRFEPDRRAAEPRRVPPTPPERLQPGAQR
jgi:capsular polysaccharide biosynthesis protein